MANMCSVNMVFASRNFYAINTLHAKMDKLFRGNDYSALGKLMEYHGYESGTYDELCVRGDYMNWVDSKVGEKEGVYYFSASAETKWYPHVGIFYILLKEKYYGCIDFYWLGEECGCEIYQKCDPTGIWFGEQFKVEYCYGDSTDCNYFNTYKETIAFTKEAFPEAEISEHTSPDKVEDAVNEKYEDRIEGDEYYYHIYTFRQVECSYEEYKRLMKEAKNA